MAKSRPDKSNQLCRKHTPFPWSSEKRFSYSLLDHTNKDKEGKGSKMSSELNAIVESDDNYMGLNGINEAYSGEFDE